MRSSTGPTTEETSEQTSSETFEAVEQRLDATLLRIPPPSRPARWRPTGDVLGVIVVSLGITGLLGLSLLIGPRPPEVVAPVEEVEVVAPVEEAPTAPEPAVDLPPAPPATLRIGSIAVDAPVVPVGLIGTEMEIPEDVREIGWYDPSGLGVRPGSTGTAVFASHVDSRSQGRGVLFELRQMRVGDTLEIDLEDGTTQLWSITEVAQIPKVSMPLTEIFTWAGPARVVIITCGGEFNRSTRSYVDNVVVYAEPLADAPAVVLPDA
jgi:hypothetical protein